MEFGTPFPFLRVAFERATHDVRGLREFARVSLRSPGVDVVLVRLVRLPRSLRLGLMWADADAVVDCVADAIDAYRLTQDENYDVSDPDAEVAELDRLDAEYEASLDGTAHPVPFDNASVVSRLDAEREAVDAGMWRITRQTGPRDLADALVGDLAWVETADDSTGANARPVHFLLGSIGPVWRPLDREAREKLARDKMETIRGAEDEWGVPDRLCVARIRAGLSRAQAARQLGEDMISIGDLREMENGAVVATLADLARLADLYDVSVEWLRGESAPSPLRAAVSDSGLSWADKVKLKDALDSMAPGDGKRMNLCHTCQTRPVLHEALSGGWFVECPGCGDATADHHDADEAVEAWSRDLIRLPADASCSPALSDEDRARLNEIRETIGFMQQRLEQGQGELESSMCRLSLPMSLDLLRLAERGDAPAHAPAQPKVEPEPDLHSWREVAEVTLDEWLACSWWEWRYSDRFRPVRQSSREMRSVPVFGRVRRVPVLKWPEMDGERWLDAIQVTTDMLVAWPVWQEKHGESVSIHRVSLATSLLGVRVAGGQWRPLRLPGMSTDPATLGEIASEDMTPEHFERVEKWQWCPPGGIWSEPCEWTMRDVRPSVKGESWRPAVFGRSA